MGKIRNWSVLGNAVGAGFLGRTDAAADDLRLRFGQPKAESGRFSFTATTSGFMALDSCVRHDILPLATEWAGPAREDGERNLAKNGERKILLMTGKACGWYLSDYDS